MTITLKKFFDNLDCIDRVLSGESVIWRPETPEEEHLLNFFRPKTHRIEDEIIHTFYRFSSLEKVIYDRVISGCASKVDTGNSLSNFIPEARLDEEIPGRLNFYHLALFQALSSFESASCDWADSVVAYKQESPGVFTRYDNHEYVHQLICDSLEELFEHSTQQLYTVRGFSFRQLLELDRIEKIYFSDLEIFTYQIIRESIDDPIPMKTVERILSLKDKGSLLSLNQSVSENINPTHKSECLAALKDVQEQLWENSPPPKSSVVKAWIEENYPGEFSDREKAAIDTVLRPRSLKGKR